MQKLKEDSIEAIKGTFDRLMQRSQARQAFFRNFIADSKKFKSLPEIKSIENPSQDKQKEFGCS